MNELWAGAVMAYNYRTGKVESRAAWARTSTKESAQALFMEYALTQFPPEEGWTEHRAHSAVQIPREEWPDAPQ